MGKIATAIENYKDSVWRCEWMGRSTLYSILDSSNIALSL